MTTMELSDEKIEVIKEYETLYDQLYLVEDEIRGLRGLDVDGFNSERAKRALDEAYQRRYRLEDMIDKLIIAHGREILEYYFRELLKVRRENV